MQMKYHQRSNSCQRTDFLSDLFAQFLYVFLKSKVVISFYLQEVFTVRTWELLITNKHLMIFFVTKKKRNFIWIHFHTVILKPQSKAFRRTLNFMNYFQFWTTHWKLSVLICITYYVSFFTTSLWLNMEPCGTLYITFVQLLNVLFNFAFYFRWL